MRLINKIIKFQTLERASDGLDASYKVDGKGVTRGEYEHELKRFHFLRKCQTESDSYRDMAEGGRYTLKITEITQYIFPFLNKDNDKSKIL